MADPLLWADLGIFLTSDCEFSRANQFYLVHRLYSFLPLPLVLQSNTSYVYHMSCLCVVFVYILDIS